MRLYLNLYISIHFYVLNLAAIASDTTKTCSGILENKTFDWTHTHTHTQTDNNLMLVSKCHIQVLGNNRDLIIVYRSEKPTWLIEPNIWEYKWLCVCARASVHTQIHMYACMWTILHSSQSEPKRQTKFF